MPRLSDVEQCEHTFAWSLALERAGRDHRTPLFTRLYEERIVPPPRVVEMKLEDMAVWFTGTMRILSIALSRPDLAVDVATGTALAGTFSGPSFTAPGNGALVTLLKLPTRQVLSASAYLLPGAPPGLAHVWMRCLFTGERH